jgi:uncharacterized membrane protein
MKKFPFIFLGLGTVGFIDSLYLAITHFTSNSVLCDGTNECNLVLSSEYSTFLGIPVAFFGLFFYIYIIFIASIMLDKIKKDQNLNPILITPFAFVAFLASAWFTYLQAFVINAYCTYCLLSATISTLIFITAIINCKKSSKNQEKAEIKETTESA